MGALCFFHGSARYDVPTCATRSELAHEDAIRELKQENDKNVTKLRQQYEREVRELQSKYELKMKLLRDDLELRRKVTPGDPS